MVVPNDCNIKKAPKRMNKYVNLQIECQIIWNKKVEVSPVITDATGLVEKNLQRYLGRIPGQHSICNLQRSAILGTAHVLRKVLLNKYD